jgi:outer membrane protein
MTRHMGCAFVLAAVLAALPAHAETFSLNDALGAAYVSNPQLAAQRAALRATDETVAQANAGWRPTINATGSYGPEHTEISGIPPAFGPATEYENDHPLQGQVIITEPLFRGGRTYAEIGRAKALVRAGRAQLIGTEQTVLLASVTAYVDMVRDQAILDLRQKNVDVLKKQLNATQEEFSAGSLTRTDVAQSQARLASAQSDLTAAQGQIAISRANFEQVIGRPPPTLDARPVLPTQLPGTEDETLAQALRQNPVLVAAKETERAADYAVDDAIGALAPQLSLQGQYFTERDSLSSIVGSFGPGGPSGNAMIRTTAILAELNVPIYQGGADEATVRQQKELHSQAQLNSVYAERQVRDNVRSAWSAFQSAEATIASNESSVTANQLAFEGVSKEQQVGGRTILDVLNAEQELLNAQVAVVTSQRNAIVAAYALLAASGRLTARDLGLQVKLYDPHEHYNDDADAWFGFGD